MTGQFGVTRGICERMVYEGGTRQMEYDMEKCETIHYVAYSKRQVFFQ